MLSWDREVTRGRLEAEAGTAAMGVLLKSWALDSGIGFGGGEEVMKVGLPVSLPLSSRVLSKCLLVLEARRMR